MASIVQDRNNLFCLWVFTWCNSYMKALVAKTTLVALKDLNSKRLEDGYSEHPADITYQELEKELKQDGLLYPIKVRKSDMVVITGTQSCWFSNKNGYTHISVNYEE